MTGWVMEALVASAVLMVVILLVRRPVRRMFGPQLAYALWSLPLLRLMMPPLPASWREQAAMPIARAGEVMTVLVAPDVAPATTAMVAAPVGAALPWGAIAAGVWLLGAASFFVLHFVRHRRFCRRLLAEARVLDRIDGVRVIETPAASGPLAFGMARRFVAFPHDFAERYDADERALALAHELGHHARGDLIANWAALAVLAFHWFNPLAWHAFRAFRCDQELANDARVLAGRSLADRHIYACAIVKAAHGGAISAACHLHTITDLKGRLTMLTHVRLSRTRWATGAAAIIGAITAGLAATASGTQAAAALTAKVETIADRQIAPPAPPLPPVLVAPQIPSAPPVALPNRPLPAVSPITAVPPVPPAAAAGTTTQVVIVRDGKTMRHDGAAAAPYIAAHFLPATPPIHRVFSRDDCPAATGQSIIMRGVEGSQLGERIIIVCPKPVSQSAGLTTVPADAAARQAGQGRKLMAMLESRSDLERAVASIRFARRSIEAERSLTADQRRDALAGLDEAMRELGEQKRP